MPYIKSSTGRIYRIDNPLRMHAITGEKLPEAEGKRLYAAQCLAGIRTSIPGPGTLYVVKMSPTRCRYYAFRAPDENVTADNLTGYIGAALGLRHDGAEWCHGYADSVTDALSVTLGYKVRAVIL